MRLSGIAMDWTERIADAAGDPEAVPAGSTEPQYQVSEQVTASRDHGLYVYHIPDDQLGQGSSFGNACCWAETKGNNDMLSLFSIDVGKRIIGGMSITYLLPFSDISKHGIPLSQLSDNTFDRLTRPTPGTSGCIHLHPAYQQRELVIGDGLRVLETFFVPRTGLDDPAVAHSTVHLCNQTSHPIGITIVGSLDLRGWTPMDMVADFDKSLGAIISWNKSSPNWVRVFGADLFPGSYWATTDEESAYSPGESLPNKTDECGDLTAALQYYVTLLPGRTQKLRFTVAFSPDGRGPASAVFRDEVQNTNSLKETKKYYYGILDIAVINMPDDLLTHAMQWAKACLVRPISKYNVGVCSTNDPGNSSNIVGRDTAWYTHGSDWVDPSISCSMLKILSEHQRDDGLIPEYIEGNTGKAVDYGFNINDGTPLYLMAVGHHVKISGHIHCARDLYESCRKVGELILKQRDENGLVKCTQEGIGPKAICGWRNVLQNESLSGVVTEVNSECYAALIALGDIAEMLDDMDSACRYRAEAAKLKDNINRHLINPKNGLYVRNIDLDGHVHTQVTADEVFPLICGVADSETTRIISARLAEHDFMTSAGIRVLPSENPRYDPSFESGCLGGVWPGVTWWYAMSCSHISPKIMADSLRRAYWHYVADPKVYNTVPGQFSEWSDGQTLVNRGMRLSPWESPRFVWAAIEGLAGLKLNKHGVWLDPQLPMDWQWLMLQNLPYKGRNVSYFIARQNEKLHVYTACEFQTNLALHKYDKELPNAPEPITTGVVSMAFRKGNETLICVGSNQDIPALGPFLTHQSLSDRTCYRVLRLESPDEDWQDLGTIRGINMMRLAVRVAPRGYSLYRFQAI